MSNRTPVRGLKSLLHDAVDATVGLVRDGHESISRGVTTVGDVAGVGGPVRTVESARMTATNGILRAVTVVNRTLETATDAALDLATSSSDEASTRAVALRDDIAWGREWWSDTLVGSLNGAIGDHLARRGNPLGADMVLRIDDRYYVPRRCAPNAFDKLERIAIFVHGLASTEWSWVLGSEQSWGDAGTCFGTLLQQEFGVTPVYIRYNTGRTIAENGADLALLLGQLHRRSPNLRSIDIYGHSMGGLVTREACRVGTARKAPWTDLIENIFYLGSPHRGAPLARIARGVAGVLGAVDLPATQIIANIIDGRSGGIKNLADGLDDALAIPNARHTFVSGTVTREPNNPVGWVLGDLLVRRPSAEGVGLESNTINLSKTHRGRVLHHELQNHPAVFEIIRQTLSTPHNPREATDCDCSTSRPEDELLAVGEVTVLELEPPISAT